ncbi:cytochrome P450 [Zhongshania sp.]|uniref:cytochrome P450 n=1 Tax=Zhongshania sp. TaxID=1971902 RepID=UPI001B5CFDE3|nr:cytochrome P450 [Zhongshania sp.]MBQ0794889.1 cytochrome P450 [Zhongshania sp.]
MQSVSLPDHTPDHVPAELVFNYDYHGDRYHGERDAEARIHDSLQRLHTDAPEIFYTPKNGGHWVVRSFQRISDVVQDPEHFSAKEMQIPRIENPPFFIPLNVDPPNNIPYRQALMPAFSPKAIRDLEGKIRYWAGSIIDDTLAKGNQFDFMGEVSSIFPVSVFMELMGMPMERLKEFRALSDSFFGTNDQTRIHELSAQIIGIMTEILMEKKENPKDDLMSHILTVKIKDQPISLEEMQNMCFLLFLGGMDTVTNVTGFSFRQLAGMPELQQRLQENPEDIAKFTDEGIRCFGVISNPRIVAKDCEMFGINFKKDDMILCLLPISGRDESVNKNASAFDIDRAKEDSQTLTFSKGPHLCLGHFLAKTEIRILAEEWVKRVKSFHLTEGKTLNFRAGFALAYHELPLTVLSK